MKVFYHKYDGHWPVGSVNLIVAENINQAVMMQIDSLKKQGLDTNIKSKDFVEVDMSDSKVHILLDGNY